MAVKFGSRAQPSRQTGITLVGLLFWAVLLSSLALVSLKVFPAINEYRTVLSMVNKVAQSGGASVADVRRAFDTAKQVEYGVESVSGADLEITKEDEKLVISFAYDKEIPLVEPVYILIKFQGRSK